MLGSELTTYDNYRTDTVRDTQTAALLQHHTVLYSRCTRDSSPSILYTYAHAYYCIYYIAFIFLTFLGGSSM